MKKKKVSMADIAHRTGISKNAVSLALSGKKGVSDETRELVVRTSQEMGYRFEIQRNEETGKIAVITPDYCLMDPYFFSDLLGAIEKEIRKRGYSLILGAVSVENMTSGRLPNLVLKNKLDGIIIVSDIGERLLQSLVHTSTPKVVVGHCSANLGMDSVLTENVDGAYNAVIYLGRCGLRRIGFIGDIYSDITHYERWEGYKKALAALNVDLDLAICYVGKENSSESAAGYEGKRLQLLNGIKEFIDEQKDLPEAFFCASNPTAVILHNTLTARRIAIPGDVSVIGFDDSEMMRMLEPPVTMVNVNKEFYGQRAVEQLFYNMKYPDKPLEVIRIAPELVVRHSVR